METITATSLPSGHVERSGGTVRWVLSDGAKTCAVSISEYVINNIVYRGTARVHKKGDEWVALYGDVYLSRTFERADPTRAAMAAFKEMAEALAFEVDNPENRLEIEIAELWKTIFDARDENRSLCVKITENDDLIRAAQIELDKLGVFQADPVPG